MKKLRADETRRNFADIQFRTCHIPVGYISLSVVLYGVKLGLSHYGKTLLMLSENRVVRRIFGPKREEIKFFMT
jgi:hypothetical protein